MITDPELAVEKVQHGLTTRYIGQCARYFPTIGSTNTELKILAAAGASEGMLLITDEQLAGRGRFERRWDAPPGSSLLMSLLFRPAFLTPARLQQLTMLCALAAADAIASCTGVMVDLKWPNDLIYRGRKLAGVLTEAGFEGDRVVWVVVGIGINVNQDFRAADPPLSETATSLLLILGEPVPRLPLLQTYLLNVETRYEKLRAGHSPHLEWAGRLATLGRRVTVRNADQSFTGQAEAVDALGALLVRRADGRLERVLAGDVTLS